MFLFWVSIKPKNMSDSEKLLADPKEYIEKLEGMTKELSGRLDKIHDQEFRKTVIQPLLMVVTLAVVFVCYLYVPVALFGIVFACFVLSWSFPALQVPLWIAIVLLVFVGFHVVTGQFSWTWTPGNSG